MPKRNPDKACAVVNCIGKAYQYADKQNYNFTHYCLW